MLYLLQFYRHCSYSCISDLFLKPEIFIKTKSIAVYLCLFIMLIKIFVKINSSKLKCVRNFSCVWHQSFCFVELMLWMCYVVQCFCCILLQSELKVDVTEPFRRQGSFRKVLPSLPTANSQLSMSAKMIDRPAVSNRGLQKAYSQYQQEYSIISE